MFKNGFNGHEPEGRTERTTILADTGAGYLVIKARMEYQPDYDRWFLGEHQLIGVTEIQEPGTVRKVLASFGVRPEKIAELLMEPIEVPDQMFRAEE